MARKKGQRQHMTPEGPKDCGAKSPASCPMKDENGNPAQHFDNAELANEAWEEKNQDKAMEKITKKQTASSDEEKGVHYNTKEAAERALREQRDPEGLKAEDDARAAQAEAHKGVQHFDSKKEAQKELQRQVIGEHAFAASEASDLARKRVGSYLEKLDNGEEATPEERLDYRRAMHNAKAYLSFSVQAQKELDDLDSDTPRVIGDYTYKSTVRSNLHDAQQAHSNALYFLDKEQKRVNEGGRRDADYRFAQDEVRYASSLVSRFQQQYDAISDPEE